MFSPLCPSLCLLLFCPASFLRSSLTPSPLPPTPLLFDRSPPLPRLPLSSPLSTNWRSFCPGPRCSLSHPVSLPLSCSCPHTGLSSLHLHAPVSQCSHPLVHSCLGGCGLVVTSTGKKERLRIGTTGLRTVSLPLGGAGGGRAAALSKGRLELSRNHPCSVEAHCPLMRG